MQSLTHPQSTCNKMLTVWSIGGSDASGAAGIQADLKTLQNFGVHGSTILTAVTAQGLEDFAGQTAVSGAMVDAQFAALAGDLAPAAVKIGMLSNSDIVRRVAAALTEVRAPIVVDPVLRSSSGTALLEPDAVQTCVQALFPLATLVTPNLPEAELLTGMKIATKEDMQHAATALLRLGAPRVLLKGGHANSDAFAHDYYADATTRFWITSPRHGGACRGTGCAFAAAAAAVLARGYDARDAVVVAKSYVSRGIRESEQRPGDGPRLLKHSPWPVGAKDWPWVTSSLGLARERPTFPATSEGARPLGFYPVVDRSAWIARLGPLGVSTIQLRVKDLTGEALDQEIKDAVRISQKFGIRLFINDFWQKALAFGAYGVHLGQEDLLDTDFDALAKGGIRLGISTHSYYEAAVANALRPSYVALGPIFPTTCKSMTFGPQGLAKIEEWHRLFDLPVVAIGGMKPEHVAAAKAFGADGVAVISDVLHSAHPEERARQWLALFERNPDDSRLS